jgi:hypothetical protein
MMASRRFAAALLLGLVVRVATLPLPGHEDVTTWKIWSYAGSRDVTAMYGVGGDPPARGIVTWGELWTTVDYPPLFLYEYALVGRVYGALFPRYPDGLPLLIAVKLPVLLASAGLAWLLHWAVRRVAQQETPARWAALAYWLNPATIFGGEMLGYVDPVFMLPAIAALVLAHSGRAGWSGMLAGLAIATKPQAILIGPALAVTLWSNGGLLAMTRAGIVFGGVLFSAGLPFYLRGALPNMWLAFGTFFGRRDSTSNYAANIGWIINWALRGQESLPTLGFPQAFLQLVPRAMSISTVRGLGYPNPRPIGSGLALVATAWASWRVWTRRDLSLAAALAAFTVHAFFIFSMAVHESHQLFEVPLLVLAAALRPRFRPLCLAVSAIITLNINFLYGIGIGLGWAVPRMLTGLDISVVLSFANVGAFIWLAFALAAAAGD